MTIEENSAFDFYKKNYTKIFEKFNFYVRRISGDIYPISVFLHQAKKVAWNVNGPQEFSEYSESQIKIMENGGRLNCSEGGHLVWHVAISVPNGQYLDFFEQLTYHGQSSSQIRAYISALKGISRYLHDYKNKSKLDIENIYPNYIFAKEKRSPLLDEEETQ